MATSSASVGGVAARVMDDPMVLVGMVVLAPGRHRLGRVEAIVHRAGGRDALVVGRRWFRLRACFMDIDELRLVGGRLYLDRPDAHR